MHACRMDLFSLALIVSVFSATCIGAVISGESTTGTAAYCQIGTYRFSNGEIVDIARSEGDTFRWRKFDGTTGVLHKKEDGSWTSTLGWTDRPDGHTASFARCANGEIQFDGKKAHRIAFDATDTLFEGRSGTKLAGRLVLPKGNERIPILVLVHGAEREEAQQPLARMSFVFIAFGAGSSAVLGSAVICGSPGREIRRFRPHG
jgi:uncharacterized protein